MPNIYSYITEQESAFKKAIPLEKGWYWNFPEHIARSFLYKNSQFEENNEDRELRPYKNIIRPIINVHYRTEGFDVKDIDLFVDNADTYYKSFLLKKFHEKWALQNEMDTFIDEVVESFVDYGGVLVKNVRSVRPEVVDLRTLAFCDQTDILSGPFAIKHYFSPSQLREMKKVGWDDQLIEYLILKSENQKVREEEQGTTQTPGRYIEIYEIHNVSGMDIDYTSEESDPMIYVCGLYQDDQGNGQGVTIFKNREPKLPFKFLKRDPIQGRALGFGGIEELFEPQVWTNFAQITIAEMLHHASKVLYLTTDTKFKGQNLKTKKTGSVLDLTAGNTMEQLDNQPRNLNAFNNFVVEMHEHAMEVGAASDLSLGQQPNSGTPFKSVETQLVEGKSLHLWRQGRIAVFIDEIYRDWVIPHLAKEITKGAKFLSELSADELMSIAESISINYANSKFKESLLKGELKTQEEYNEERQFFKDNFMRMGTKRFIEILKDEFSNEKLGVSTNIAGKQKNLALFTDKMVNVLRQFIATPEMRQDPEMVKFLNTILESSGMSPITFGPRLQMAQTQGSASTDGLKQLAKTNENE